MPRRVLRTSSTIAASSSVVMAAALSACSSSSTSSSASAASSATVIASAPAPSIVGNVIAPPGYNLKLWAKGTNDYSNPDNIEIDGSHIWVGYQNVTAKDGSDGKTSTVVEYTTDGKVVKTFTVPGHTDGMRIDPSTHLVWVTSNEDGNPTLVTIDQGSGAVTPYTLAKTAHGGGYDDLAFVNGSTFIACSNPTLDASGNNVFPAIDKITLAGTAANVTPALMGNAQAQDVVANAPTQLNLTDPDSMKVDPQGELVLQDQADSVLVTIKNPGSPSQSVTKVSVGTQLDDTVFTGGKPGHLFIVDGKTNSIYTVTYTIKSDTVFSEAPDDSGVVGFVGTVDLGTGTVHPLITGFVKPTGLMFVPDITTG